MGCRSDSSGPQFLPYNNTGGECQYCIRGGTGQWYVLGRCRRAYVQALLKSLYETWVAIPYELWPKDGSWKGMKRPMCRLVKALYGHPESGAHWEAPLPDAVKALGGTAIWNFPSNFWFPKDRLSLTVYGDDLLLSGPIANHKPFWERLQRGSIPIKIDPPEALDRFLGRKHILSPLKRN